MLVGGSRGRWEIGNLHPEMGVHGAVELGEEVDEDVGL